MTRSTGLWLAAGSPQTAKSPLVLSANPWGRAEMKQIR